MDSLLARLGNRPYTRFYAEVVISTINSNVDTEIDISAMQHVLSVKGNGRLIGIIHCSTTTSTDNSNGGNLKVLKDGTRLLSKGFLYDESSVVTKRFFDEVICNENVSTDKDYLYFYLKNKYILRVGSSKGYYPLLNGDTRHLTCCQGQTSSKHSYTTAFNLDEGQGQNIFEDSLDVYATIKSSSYPYRMAIIYDLFE